MFQASMFPTQFLGALPNLDDNVHKFSRGKVCVVAGSSSYPGAAMMAAKSAARSGAGFVSLCVPDKIVRTCQTNLPSIVVSPLKSNKNGFIKKSEKLEPKFKNQDAILFGPGVGKEADLTGLLESILKIDTPVIIDADGIETFSKLLKKRGAKTFKKRTAPIIITPHRGELKRFLQDDCDIDFNRLSNIIIKQMVQQHLKKFKKLNLVVVAKGVETLIITKELCLEPMGGNGVLATSGTGDVLAGTIAGMIAQNKPKTINEAAGSCACAVEVHAVAGYIAGKDFGIRGALATDICEKIGQAQDLLRTKVD